MKKLLLATFAACSAWSGAQAQSYEYQGDLVVTVDDYTTPSMPTTVSAEFLEELLVNVELKNFTLQQGEDVIPVGNIQIDSIPLTPQDGYYSFDLKNKITIVTAGDPGTDWMGPTLFPDGLPIDISGKISETKLYCTLDIVFGPQHIHVTFGTDFTSSVRPSVVGEQTQILNVYDLQGTLVKSNAAKADALNGLRRGVYIVDGRKVVKK